MNKIITFLTGVQSLRLTPNLVDPKDTQPEQAWTPEEISINQASKTNVNLSQFDSEIA